MGDTGFEPGASPAEEQAKNPVYTHGCQPDEDAASQSVADLDAVGKNAARERLLAQISDLDRLRNASPADLLAISRDLERLALLLAEESTESCVIPFTPGSSERLRVVEGR